ncbi:MAG: hypothetical protein WED07_15040 [Candidatus Freyarchaeum deiterrae]
MNELLEKLTGGDLRSDGRGDEVADEVIRNPLLLDKLVEGLSESDDVIRARTVHALERISRTKPELLQGLTSRFIELADTDTVPMVKWHLAMIFGNMTFSEKETDTVVSALFRLLKEDSVFVKSWAIVSLTIIGRKNMKKKGEISSRIKTFQNDKSIAIRTKVAKALRILENENEQIPPNWIKGDFK